MANNGNEGRTATEPEPILTIAPFFFFNIAGSTDLVTQVAASEFTLIRLSVIFQSTSWKNRALGYETPALFIRTPTSNSLILPSIAFDISGPLNVAKSATTFFYVYLLITKSCPYFIWCSFQFWRVSIDQQEQG